MVLIRPARIDAWAWVLIYVGMVLIALGLALQRTGAAFTWLVAGLGIASVLVGLVLIWLRSRMATDANRPANKQP